MPKIQRYQNLVPIRNVAGGSPRARALPLSDMDLLSNIGSEIQNVMGEIERKNLINEAKKEREIEKQRAEAEQKRKKTIAQYKKEKETLLNLQYDSKLDIDLLEKTFQLNKNYQNSTDFSNNVANYSNDLDDIFSENIDAIETSDLDNVKKALFLNKIKLHKKNALLKYEVFNDKALVEHHKNELELNVENFATFRTTNKIWKMNQEQSDQHFLLEQKVINSIKMFGKVNHHSDAEINAEIKKFLSDTTNEGLQQFYTEDQEGFLATYGIKENGNWILDEGVAPLNSTIPITKLTEWIKTAGKAKDKKEAAKLTNLQNEIKNNEANTINVLLRGGQAKFDDDLVLNTFTGENADIGETIVKQRNLTRDFVEIMEETQNFNQYTGSGEIITQEVLNEIANDPKRQKHLSLYEKIAEAQAKILNSNRQNIQNNGAEYVDSQILKNIDNEVWGELSEEERIDNRRVWYEQHGVPQEYRKILSDDTLVKTSGNLLKQIQENPEDALELYTAFKNDFGSHWNEAFNLFRGHKGGSLLPPSLAALDVYKSAPSIEQKLVEVIFEETKNTQILEDKLDASKTDLDNAIINVFEDVRLAMRKSGRGNETEWQSQKEIYKKLILLHDKTGTKSLQKSAQEIRELLFGDNGDFYMYDYNNSDVIIPRYNEYGEFRNLDLIQNNFEFFENSEPNFERFLDLEENKNVVIPNAVIARNLGASLFVNSPIPNNFNKQEQYLLNEHRTHLNNGTYLTTAGGVTTVRTIGVHYNGKEYIVPSYIQGKVLDIHTVVEYLTNNNLWDNYPSYNSVAEAEAANTRLRTIIEPDGNHSVIQEEIKNAKTIFTDHWGKSYLATHANGQGVVMYMDTVDGEQIIVKDNGEPVVIPFDDPMDWLLQNQKQDNTMSGVVN